MGNCKNYQRDGPIVREHQGTCLGMTAVIRRAEAVLQALIIIRSSMSPSLMSPGAVLCKMKTGRIRHSYIGRKRGYQHTIFVSHTGCMDSANGFWI